MAYRALKARINRVLRPQGLQFVAALGSTRVEALGTFYVLDVQRNVVVRERVEIEAFGRELEVLRPFEVLAR